MSDNANNGNNEPVNEENIDFSKLELASNQNRVLAFVIDDIIVTFLVMIILWDKISASSGDMENVFLVMNKAVLDIILLKFLYQTFFVWNYGASLGKMALKIKVIDHDHFGRVSLQSAAIRSFGRILSEAVFYLGFLLSFFNDARQTFHDKIAKTLVVVDYSKQ
jgi:uncharacterized RDD family membrane protein YckC